MIETVSDVLFNQVAEVFHIDHVARFGVYRTCYLHNQVVVVAVVVGVVAFAVYPCVFFVAASATSPLALVTRHSRTYNRESAICAENPMPGCAPPKRIPMTVDGTIVAALAHFGLLQFAGVAEQLPTMDVRGRSQEAGPLIRSAEG